MRYANNFCIYTEDMTHYIFSGTCMKCKKTIEIQIPKEALYKYNQGAFIQDAMSMLNKGEREFLMSGYCSTCFTIIAKEIEEEE
jgi:hypothetical protein